MTPCRKSAVASPTGTRRMSEVQDVFREYGEEYMRIQKPLPHVCKAIRAIAACRTAALGGHTDTCDECGHTKQSYNSCRNRHCPKCQALAKERWILAREAELLPVPYFHVVFTLPSELNEFVMRNRKIMLNLLFQAFVGQAAQSISDPLPSKATQLPRYPDEGRSEITFRCL